MLNTNHHKRIALFAIILGAWCLGSSPIFVRLGEAGPSAIAFWRVALSLPIAYAWMRMENRLNYDYFNKNNNTYSSNIFRANIANKKLLIILIASFFWVGDLIFWHLSLSKTNIANSTFLATSSPIFITIAAWFLFGEKYTRLFLLGAGITVVGSIVLMSATLNFDNGSIVGDGLSLITAFCFGAFVLAVRQLRKFMGAGTIMFYTALISAPCFLIISILSGEIFFPNSLQGWGALLGLAIITQILGQGLLAYGLGQIKAGAASILILIEPIVAALLAWLVLSEALNPLQAAGCLLIILGIIVVQKQSSAYDSQAN